MELISELALVFIKIIEILSSLCLHVVNNKFMDSNRLLSIFQKNSSYHNQTKYSV
jgi:hypothetical protein